MVKFQISYSFQGLLDVYISQFFFFSYPFVSQLIELEYSVKQE